MHVTLTELCQQPSGPLKYREKKLVATCGVPEKQMKLFPGSFSFFCPLHYISVLFWLILVTVITFDFVSVAPLQDESFQAAKSFWSTVSNTVKLYQEWFIAVILTLTLVSVSRTQIVKIRNKNKIVLLWISIFTNQESVNIFSFGDLPQILLQSHSWSLLSASCNKPQSPPHSRPHFCSNQSLGKSDKVLSGKN